MDDEKNDGMDGSANMGAEKASPSRPIIRPSRPFQILPLFDLYVSKAPSSGVPNTFYGAYSCQKEAYSCQKRFARETRNNKP